MVNYVQKMLDISKIDIEGIEFIGKLVEPFIGQLLRQYMHTTYHIDGGVIYYVNGKQIILPTGSPHGYEVKFSERINDFITDGSSELFDLLTFNDL